MLPGGAFRIVSSSASSSALSASSPGSVLNSQPACGAHWPVMPGSASAQRGAAAGQSFAVVAAKVPNATGTAPTTTELAVAPEGSRIDSTPELPLATRTRPSGSTATPSGPDAVGRLATTTFSAVSIATTVSCAASLTQARARSGSTATPKGFRPTLIVVRTVRLTRPMTLTEPAPKSVT